MIPPEYAVHYPLPDTTQAPPVSGDAVDGLLRKLQMDARLESQLLGEQ